MVGQMEGAHHSKVALKKNDNTLLLYAVRDFYTRNMNIHMIVPIIEGSTHISLRLIDWFVTNFSKKHKTVITRRSQDSNIYHFNVHLSYRSQLRAFTKQCFDPFRRRDRINFHYDTHDDSKNIETTVGQLNFFRWVLSNDILRYIDEHYIEIDEDMIKTSKEHIMRKQDAEVEVSCLGDQPHTPSKRVQLSGTSVKNMNRFEGRRIIGFT